MDSSSSVVATEEISLDDNCSTTISSSNHYPHKHHLHTNGDLFTLTQINEEESPEEEEKEIASSLADPSNNIVCIPIITKSIDPPLPPSSRSSPTPPLMCTDCQKTEEAADIRLAQVKTQFETEITRLKTAVESATKTKESVVMKYATGEMELLKMKKSIENSDKLIKQLNNDIEIVNKKNKMLSSERERLSLMIDAKVHDIEDLQKEINRCNQEIQAKDFKFTWTQNKLREESEAHNNTKQKLEDKISEIEKELLHLKQSTNGELSSTSHENAAGDTDIPCQKQNGNGEENTTSSPCPEENNEIVILRENKKQLMEDNNNLSSKIIILEHERLDLETTIRRVQESNSEHLHQIAALQSDLAATDCLKVQLQKETELIQALENECAGLRQSYADVLNDMAICRSKEAELLSYTQQVTEKNVALQSNFSSVEAKTELLKDENDRLCLLVEKLESDIRDLRQKMSKESEHQLEEKQTIETNANSSKVIITQLQQQLDEARGEICLLNRKLNSSVRELSKELVVARKQVKDSHTGSDGLSQSSRTSSSSSLTNGDCPPPPPHKQEDSSSTYNNDANNDQECPIIPDQQVLIERIVKLQRMLAKKQDKVEFLQEHVKQLVESVQKKSKVIQVYAMSQDIDALSSNLAEKNRAEIAKHKGIMASVYGSKPVDDTMTLDLSLEINRKLQVVLEDTLLRNITLKDSLNTLGKEISKLTEENQELLQNYKLQSSSSSNQPESTKTS